MLALLVVLLFLGGLFLWSRVSDLEHRLKQFERTLTALKRDPPRAAAEPERAAHEPAAPQTVQSPPAAARTWNPPPVQPAPPRPESPPAAAPMPQSPSMVDVLVGAVKDYFTGGNLVVRVGIIVLFFGVGFLLKYAAEHAQLSIQVRLVGVALGAFGLLVLGWVLRKRRRGFALALQGGAVGILYLTLFAALQFYQLLPAEVTFALMAALGVGLCLLAIQQDSLALSMLGATGGFLAPVLASSGQGSHVVLFSYYALLNLFIVAQAWFKAWRPLNLLAFVFTFGVGTAWGVLRYDPAQFATTEPFLLLYFAQFVIIAVLFAFRRAPQLNHYVDGTLVFGTPVVAMALQMELVRELPHGRAWSALGAGVVYMLLAAWLHRAQRDTLRLLRDSFLALGVAFLTLAVPLWLDDAWTTATWALEGAALVWIGLRQVRWLPAVSGVLLQIAAAVAYGLHDAAPPLMPVVNASCLGALFIAAAGLFSARVAAQPHAMLVRIGSWPSSLLLAWGLGWWLFAGSNEIREFVPHNWHAGALLGFCAVTAFVCGWLAQVLSWRALCVPALAILPLMVAMAPAWCALHSHPFNQGGWLAWPVAFASLWLSLRRHEASMARHVAALLHGLAAWLLVLLISFELVWQIDRLAVAPAWSAAAWGVPPSLLLAVLGSGVVERVWPLRSFAAEFRGWVACGLAVLLVAWLLWLNGSSDGAAAPLPYMPLLNPVDLASALAVFVTAGWLQWLWQRGGGLSRDMQLAMVVALTATAFFWLNALLLRTMHHWRGVPWQLDALLADTAVQAALSIFWTLLALGAMLWATRRGWRVLWFCGAALMAVVVAKLFLVDLVRVGTIARIVSFLVVGGLMLVIGYFSPLPPKGRKA